MKTSDILKFIDYKIISGSSYHLQGSEALLDKYKLNKELRLIEYQDDSEQFSNRSFDGDILVHGDTVIRITLSFPQKYDGYFRWTNPKHRKLFHKIYEDSDEDNYAYDNVKYTEVFLLEDMLTKIKDMLEKGTCSLDVSYPIDIDEELLSLAKIKAQEQNISVEDFLSKTISSNKKNFKNKQ